MRVSNMSSIQSLSAYYNRTAAVSKKNQNGRTDSVSISALGKSKSGSKGNASDLINSLLEQKQGVIENKNKLVETTTERGKSLDSIEEQLKVFDQQVKDIDSQISKTMAEEQKKALEQNKKTDRSSDRSTKTKEEVQTAKLNSILSLSTDMSQIKVTSSVQSKMEGRAKVLEREIARDGARALSSKTKELSELKDKISNTTAKINDGLKSAEGNVNSIAGETVSSLTQTSNEGKTDSEDQISVYQQLQKALNQLTKKTVLDILA